MFKLNRSYKLVDEYGFISETLSVNRSIASSVKSKVFTVTKLDRDGNVVEIRLDGMNFSSTYFDSNVSIIISPEDQNISKNFLTMNTLFFSLALMVRWVAIQGLCLKKKPMQVF